MSNETPTKNEKKRFGCSPLRLIDWIDNHKSETVRRVSHGLLVISIAGLCGLILTQRSALKTWLESNSKSVWTLLQLPIQLQLWIFLLLLLIVFAFTWFVYWIKRNHNGGLITSARFVTQTDMHNNSRPMIQIEAVNSRPRPIRLKTFHAIFANESEAGAGLGNGSDGIQLNDQQNYTVPDNAMRVIQDPFTGAVAIDMRFEDTLGFFYPITNAKQSLKIYAEAIAKRNNKKDAKPFTDEQRDPHKLITEIEFQSQLKNSERKVLRPTTLIVSITNAGNLAATLTQIGADYVDGSSRSKKLRQGKSITLKPKEKYSATMEDVEDLVYDVEHDKRARAFWFKDLMGVKHFAEDGGSKIQAYFIDATYS